MAYIRKFKTASGATGVQVCYKYGGKVTKTIHIGSTKSPARLKNFLKKAREICDGNGGESLFSLEKFEEK